MIRKIFFAFVIILWINKKHCYFASSERFFNSKVVFLPKKERELFDKNSEIGKESRQEIQERLKKIDFIRVKHIFCFNGFPIDLKKKSAYSYVYNIFLSQSYDEMFYCAEADVLFIMVISSFVLIENLV